MKRKIQMILVISFCIVFGAKAQITKIDTYSNRFKNLPAVQKEEIDLLFFGTVPKVFISEEGNPVTLWAEKGTIRSVEINYKQVALLKDQDLANSFRSAEIIVFNIDKNNALRLDDSYLRSFSNLKYILLNIGGDISNDEVKAMLGNLLSSSSVSNQIEVIINQTSTSS